MGDGTEESHAKIQESFDDVWAYTGDLFVQDDSDLVIIAEGIGPDLKAIQPIWREKVKATLAEATLLIPEDGWMHSGSKQGRHTEHMGHILSELQYMQRTYPGCEW